MAEAYMNHASRGAWRAYSAGSHPTGEVHPLALETLRDAGILFAQPASKSWTQFECPESPHMDLIVTVCGQAERESCPVWPGHPSSMHWPFPDPAYFSGPLSDQRDHFRSVFIMIQHRIDDFLSVGHLQVGMN